VATYADLDAQIAVVLAGLPSTPTRLATSDLVDDLETVAAGATVFALRTSGFRLDEEEDSNQAFFTARLSVRMVHRLADPFDERAYTVGDLLLDQAELVLRTFWQGVAAVRDVIDGPEIAELPEREGHVIAYTVELEVRLVP
jgi:hypothetical protein